MKAGQKSVGKNGLQNSLFPMPVMYITQDWNGDYSHQGTGAIDVVGWNGSSQINRYSYYAPFDCTLTSKGSNNDGVVWTSDKEVNTPTGKKRLSIACWHDNDAKNMTVGTKKKQGQFLGKTGTAGNVTGDHAHFEWFLAGKEWQRPEGMIKPYQAIFVDGTKMYKDNGHNWKKSGDPIQDIEIICGNKYLTREEMEGNAQYIAYYMVNEGWTPESIAGLLGNAERESTINPCLWQNLNEGNLSGGFGLVQWTPASNLINWARDNNLKYKDMDTQLERILYELDNGLQWISTSGYPMTFEEFTQSTKSPEYLASAFLKNYERAGVEEEQERRDNAIYWYDRLDWSGEWSGGGGDSGTDKKKKIIALLLSDALNGWKY